MKSQTNSVIHINELLSTQIVNIARFARNVVWDFLCDFQTLCVVAFNQLRSYTQKEEEQKDYKIALRGCLSIECKLKNYDQAYVDNHWG